MHLTDAFKKDFTGMASNMSNALKTVGQGIFPNNQSHIRLQGDNYIASNEEASSNLTSNLALQPKHSKNFFRASSIGQIYNDQNMIIQDINLQ